MKNNYLYPIIGLLCSVLSYPVLAEIKIGFVNAVKVMEAAPQVESANARLEKEFATRQKKIANMTQEARKLEERLNKDNGVMSEAEVHEMNRDLMAKKRDLKREQDEFRDDYNIRRNEELDKLQKKIVEVIQSLAKDEGYDVVLSDGVVWASERIDMTEKVLKRLSEQTGRSPR